MEFRKVHTLSLNDFLQTLYRGRKIIAISFFSVLIVTTIFIFTTDPVYEATVKLLIKDDSAMTDALFGFSDLAFREKRNEIYNQVEILKSRTLAEIVLNKILNSEYAHELEIFGNRSDKKNNSFDFLTSFSRFFNLFKFENNGGSQEEKDSAEIFDEIVEELRERISIELIDYTDMILIQIKAASPTEAAYIANTLASSYLENNQLESREEVRRVKNFLEQQLAVVKNNLVRSEEALKNYKEREKVIALPQEIQELIQKLTEFETLYNEAFTDLNSAQERLRYIEEQLVKSRDNFDIETISMSPYLEGLKKKMAEIEGARAIFVANLVNRGVYNPNSAQIKQYDQQIAELKEKFKSEVTKLASKEILDPVKLSESLIARKIEVEAEIASLHPKVQALKNLVDEYSAKLESLPNLSLNLARLARAAKLDEKIYLMMKEKYEETRIKEVGQLGNVRIIDSAKPPKYPIKPKKTLNLILATFMGLGLGVAITFLLDFMDNSVRGVEEIERLGLPVLSSISVIKEDGNSPKKRRNSKVDVEERQYNHNGAQLITQFAPKSPISEAFRAFRTSIRYSKVDEPLKSILVTSPGIGEGKTTSVANLAITIAQQGSKVLLVDADLRRPILHSIFNVDKKNGLTNRLVGRISTKEAINKTAVENLFLIPCGIIPPNPSELLGSEAMKNLIDELNLQFDMILFDSPPIIAVTDPVVLSSMVDGAVLVVKAGLTNRKAILRSFTLLKNVNSQVLGVLLNCVPIDGVNGSYYYAYQYHYYDNNG
ncbi:MAG: GumC family protein [bacterium]